MVTINYLLNEVAQAWHRATPNTLFVGSLLFYLCCLGLAAVFGYFFGGK